jgi:hypothetical protein
MQYIRFLTVKETRNIKIKHSPIYECDCGTRFIMIEYELRRGFKRDKCPFCLRYLKEEDIIPS